MLSKSNIVSFHAGLPPSTDPGVDTIREYAQEILRLRAEVERHENVSKALAASHVQLRADIEECYTAAEAPAWGGPLDATACAALRKVFPTAASIVRKAMSELDVARAESARLRGERAMLREVYELVKVALYDGSGRVAAGGKIEQAVLDADAFYAKGQM